MCSSQTQLVRCLKGISRAFYINRAAPRCDQTLVSLDTMSSYRTSNLSSGARDDAVLHAGLLLDTVTFVSVQRRVVQRSRGAAHVFFLWVGLTEDTAWACFQNKARANASAPVLSSIICHNWRSYAEIVVHAVMPRDMSHVT